MRPSHRVSMLVATTVVVMSCGHETPTSASRESTSQKRPTAVSAAISDAVNSGGKRGFYFLPPIVRAPATAGTFDSDLAPEVQICRYESGSCQGPLVAVFTTTTGPGSETVRVDLASELYIVNWHTSLFQISDGATYRINVALGSLILGYADVQLFPTAKEVKNVQSETVALVDGRTLPIKFRIEQGIAVSLDVQPNPATVIVGKSLGITATIRDAHGNALTNQLVTWSTQNPAIATVDATGVATGVTPGSTVVAASSNGLTGSAQLNVIPPPVVSVEVLPSTATVIKTKTIQLGAVVKDDDGNNLLGRAITWTSTDPSIATVNASGLVTAVNLGVVTIIATCEGKSGSSEVTVIRPPVARVEIHPNPATVVEGNTVQLNATLWDADNNVLTGREFTWTSTQLSIASVNNTGLVTGASPAVVMIIGTSESVADTAEVTVTPSLVGKVATVVITPNPATVVEGETVQLNATLRDVFGTVLTGKPFVWQSSQPTIATVGFTGLVAGLIPGVVTITGISEGISGTAQVTVIPTLVGKVASVVITPNPATVVQGATVQLSATLRDAYGSVLTGKPFTWSSSSTSLATISQSGLVTGVMPGAVTITGTSEGVSGTSTVTVLPTGFLLASVSPGREHTCGLDSDGDAYCWGSNGFGQLGTGDFVRSTIPRAVVGGIKFSQISVFSQTTCALTSLGVAYCWGDNQFAQVGDGTFGGVHNVPAPVQTALRFTQIATATNPCAIALDGAAWCWGVGGEAYGPTGGTPKAVVGGHRFKSIASGGQHVCGLDPDGYSWCWGNGATEALGGHGTQPVQTAGGHKFSHIVAGQEFTCALEDPSGQAWCWGTNDFGVLGNGTSNSAFGSAVNNSPSPSPAAAGLTFVSLSAGSNHMCGLTSAGTAHCWGWNRYGQVGDGTNVDRWLPVSVAGSIPFNALGASGGEAQCAISPFGAVYCWGIGENGHLGNGTFLNKNVPTRVLPP